MEKGSYRKHIRIASELFNNGSCHCVQVETQLSKASVKAELISLLRRLRVVSDANMMTIRLVVDLKKKTRREIQS